MSQITIKYESRAQRLVEAKNKTAWLFNEFVFISCMLLLTLSLGLVYCRWHVFSNEHESGNILDIGCFIQNMMNVSHVVNKTECACVTLKVS